MLIGLRKNYNMKPLTHAQISVKKYGGRIEDYMEIHTFFDTSKATLADVRHRAILHSAFGCFLVEKVFGPYIKNSDNKNISTRQLAEDHIVDDLGFIPTVEKWLKNLPLEPWMDGRAKKIRTFRKNPNGDVIESIVD